MTKIQSDNKICILVMDDIEVSIGIENVCGILYSLALSDAKLNSI